MSDFEMEQNELDHQLDVMLDQLGPDRLPAGFTARTMAALPPLPAFTLSDEPFRLHWSDFVPALAAAIFGIIVMFIWVGTPVSLSFLGGGQANTIFASANEFQLAALFSVIGLAIAAVPLLSGNRRSRNLFLLTLNV